MKVIGLCGAAGAGKDTAASLMDGYRAIAFADALYQEVAQAYCCDVEELRDRVGKEVPQMWLTGIDCEDEGFCNYLESVGIWQSDADACKPCSPRQILQWWGDYRRAQDADYFVNQTAAEIEAIAAHHCGAVNFVITDVRFANEAVLIRQLGGEIWQIVRPGFAAGSTGHKSDTDGSEFAPDRVIVNDGDLEDLRKCLASR